MPGFDGSGPMGAGPMTGGARGYCNTASRGYGPVYGRRAGYGRGYGRGRGLRRGFAPGQGRGHGYGQGSGWRSFNAAGGAGYGGPMYGTPHGMRPEDELQMLRNEADAVRSDLEGINKRIEELQSKSSQS